MSALGMESEKAQQFTVPGYFAAHADTQPPNTDPNLAADQKADYERIKAQFLVENPRLVQTKKLFLRIRRRWCDYIDIESWPKSVQSEDEISEDDVKCADHHRAWIEEQQRAGKPTDDDTYYHAHCTSKQISVAEVNAATELNMTPKEFDDLPAECRPPCGHPDVFRARSFG